MSLSQPEPVVREDGETVGQIRPVGDAWVPETVFGGVLAEAADLEDATAYVLAHGMASLIEPWWLETDGVWDRVELVEIGPDAVRVRDWSPFNLAVGGDASAGYWVDPAERPLLLNDPAR